MLSLPHTESGQAGTARKMSEVTQNYTSESGAGLKAELCLGNGKPASLKGDGASRKRRSSCRLDTVHIHFWVAVPAAVRLHMPGLQ